MANMDLLQGKQTPDGHVQIKLGPIEKWVLGLGLAAFTYLAFDFVQGQEAQGQDIQEVKNSITEVKGDVKIVTLQTSDLAALRADVITLKLQQSTLEKQVQSIEQNQRSLVRDR